MRRFIALLCAGLLSTSQSAAGYEPDVFGTARGLANQASYDLGGSNLHCSSNAPLPERLRLEDAIERILCRDPSTQLAWASAKAQAAQVGSSKAAYLPRLNGRLGANQAYNELNYRDVPSRENRSQRYAADVELTWELFDFGRRSAALRNAQQLLLAANASQDSALQRAFSLAAQAYYEALAAQRSLEASRQVAELAAQNLEAANAKYNAGAAALSDRLQAQTALSQASLAQIRDEGTLRRTLGIIAIRMGLAPDTSLRLYDELSEQLDATFATDIERLIVDAKRDHPGLLAAQARLRAATASVEESHAAGRPSLALTANLSRSTTHQSREFSGDFRGHDRSIGLQLTVPLFEGFNRTYQIRNALARREASVAELAELEQQVSLDVWSSYQSLSMETRNLTLTRELVDQARQSLEVARGRYQSGVGIMVELLNALSAYSSAEEQYIRALSNWQISRLRLAESLGRLGFWLLQ
ncbi:hypothetical protein BVH03_24050 [Pseudomonas sp. PA15(2017)]|uniref:TolC family protein n=1 Tax=Pseudomonas sp. PA15(2017) TaxID=1932111 RepID=UPI00095A6EE1|nr:TolC family protein [Pseudomonas sp. PA15(2017)]OLU23290.1 hypothetical protein BVH03_24050 [Pseudomonas sp. PA15(2017)]